VYVAIRDILVVQVFLGSFIFFYPDVVGGRDLPITGGLAAVCAFSVLLIKLMTKATPICAGIAFRSCSWGWARRSTSFPTCSASR